MATLIELLHDCTIRVNNGDCFGTGFWVGQRLVMTCHHVTKDENVTVSIGWSNQDLSATVLRSLPNDDEDMALLQLPTDQPVRNHPCVLLHPPIAIHDKLYSFGYTKTHENGEPATCEVEGVTRNPTFLKLKGGQIERGFSGAPLLNLRTQSVCGIVARTRNAQTDLGGKAIPASTILSCLRELHLEEHQCEFHERNPLWLDT
ncbi:MAG: S1 family peptidase, partial [Pirellulaceae bacterium]